MSRGMTVTMALTMSAISLDLCPTNLHAQKNKDAAEEAYNRGDYPTAFRIWEAFARSGPKPEPVASDVAAIPQQPKSMPPLRDDQVAILRIAYMVDEDQVTLRHDDPRRDQWPHVLPGWKAEAVRERWQELAGKGSASAAFWYGVAFEKLDKNYPEAAKWYRQAASQNFAPAQYALGHLYTGWFVGADGLSKVPEGIDRDISEGISWYEKSASQGETAAMRALGELYGRAGGMSAFSPTAEEKSISYQWYRKAADRGDPAGQCVTGEYYQDQKNIIRALSWYRKAADQGSLCAYLALGHLYTDGNGVPKDYEKAIEWFSKVDGPNRDLYDMGAMATIYASPSFRGGSLAPSAAQIYRKFLQGDSSVALGQHGLGILYADGRGVPQDYWLAYMYRNLASAVIPEAAAARERIAKKMTPEQIGRAQEMARNWRPDSAVAPHSTQGPIELSSTAPRSAIDRIRGGSYFEMPQAQEIRDGTASGGITLENGTAYSITVYFSGPESRTVVIGAGQSTNLILSPGRYEVAAETSGPSVRPFYGVQSFREDGSYRTRFFIGNR